jgi:hypothetical protein
MSFLGNYDITTTHDFKDLKYWSKRWSDCFPYTYPPELSDGHICIRCKERIMTGHQCKDIYKYILEKAG